MKLNKLLAKGRAKSGLSQSEFARLMKVNQSAVSQWETGRKKPTMRNFFRACKMLKIDPKEIWEVHL